MDLKHMIDLAQFRDEKMNKVNLFESPRFFCDLYCLRPGQSQKAHTHGNNDKVYLGLQGEAIVQIGEERAPLGPGDAVLAPAGVVHGLFNETTENVTCIAVMAPHPNPPGS